MSFAGKPEANTVNRGTARLFMNYSFSNDYHASSETLMLINKAKDNDVDTFQRLEFGRAFRNGSVFYGKPGLEFDLGPFNHQWGIESGLRFVF